MKYQSFPQKFDIDLLVLIEKPNLVHNVNDRYQFLQ